MTQTITQPARSPWPHRWAVALACATFPLVWVGGLVTTTDAGMSVPDWPNTYGYNLLLYPWQTWLAGPWDIFVEHGHRLLATAVGLLTIVLLAALWRLDERRWVRRLGVAALVLVVLQGVLGGMRVLLAERTLAMVHGFTGPLFFALTVALVVVTSAIWRRANNTGGQAASGTHSAGYLRQLAVLTAVLFYLQIMIGAVLRHVPVATEPTTFALAVELHLLVAAVLLVHVAMINWSAISLSLRERAGVRGIADQDTLTLTLSQGERGSRLVGRLAIVLAGLIVLQIVLGAATWVAKYAIPYWLDRWVGSVQLTIEADGWLQTNIVTAHVAVGSLLLGTSVALALYVLRFTAAKQLVAPASLQTREASA